MRNKSFEIFRLIKEYKLMVLKAILSEILRELRYLGEKKPSSLNILVLSTISTTPDEESLRYTPNIKQTMGSGQTPNKNVRVQRFSRVKLR